MLLDLPDEVLIHILRELPTPLRRRMSKKDLKAAHLVCGRLCHLAKPLLFGTVTLPWGSETSGGAFEDAQAVLGPFCHTAYISLEEPLDPILAESLHTALRTLGKLQTLHLSSCVSETPEDVLAVLDCTGPTHPRLSGIHLSVPGAFPLHILPREHVQRVTSLHLESQSLELVRGPAIEREPHTRWLALRELHLQDCKVDEDDFAALLSATARVERLDLWHVKLTRFSHARLLAIVSQCLPDLRDLYIAVSDTISEPPFSFPDSSFHGSQQQTGTPLRFPSLLRLRVDDYRGYGPDWAERPQSVYGAQLVGCISSAAPLLERVNITRLHFDTHPPLFAAMLDCVFPPSTDPAQRAAWPVLEYRANTHSKASPRKFYPPTVLRDCAEPNAAKLDELERSRGIRIKRPS